jgi:hypothetical protein
MKPVSWTTETGYEVHGFLFVPPNYVKGEAYPLVIQTKPDAGSFVCDSGENHDPSFAPQPIAAAGMMYLIRTYPEDYSPSVEQQYYPHGYPGGIGEAAFQMDVWDSAVNTLAAQGFIDPKRVGIIGFSRSCWSVMVMLTTTPLHLKAASVTDGVMADYFQYMKTVDQGGGYDSMIGTPPFGKGLQQWLKASPGFNLDKITAPLSVVAEGPSSLLFMWGPYAGLRYLKKPVDLILLNTRQHVLTNPAVRMASQGGSVDWFRFWLQDYEDPGLAKKEQYERWRGLRKMQEENEAKARRQVTGDGPQ